MSLANSFGFNRLHLQRRLREIVDPREEIVSQTFGERSRGLEAQTALATRAQSVGTKKRARREAGSLSTLPTDYFLAEAAEAAGLAPEAALAGAGWAKAEAAKAVARTTAMIFFMMFPLAVGLKLGTQSFRRTGRPLSNAYVTETVDMVFTVKPEGTRLKMNSPVNAHQKK